jgi:hypothetical protein
MALQASGPISFSQIANEFGLPPGKNLGAYRISSPLIGSLSGLPLDEGVPQSGQIGFGNFYSKRLNVVVDLYSVPENSTRLIIKNRYKPDDAVTITGGFKQPIDLPPNGDGKRIIANVNRTIGSEKTGTNYCALRTGFWGADVNLEVVVGPSGTIIGAGGDGGAGGGINFGSAGNGGTGSSALGLQYPTKVINGGSIIAGTGGGGGGAGAYGQETNSQRRCDPNGYNALTPRIGGAGGGGGRGLPAGNGGPGNSEFSRLSNKQGGGPGSPGSPGGAGSILSNGGGGAGGIIIPQDGYSCDNRDARSGAGGGGGAGGANGIRFRPPNIVQTANASNPGSAGPSGYAIIVDSTSGNLISFTGTAVEGTNVTSTVQ